LLQLAGRNKQRRGRTGLAHLTGDAHLRGLTGPPGLRLIGPLRAAPEDRHHYQPAISKLIIANYRVAIVGGLARAAEASKKRIGRDRPVQGLARCSEPLSFLGEDRHPRIDDLEDVVQADGESVI
jgi:hypothetical protein